MHRKKVVDHQPILPGQPVISASQGPAADAGMVDSASNRDQTVFARRIIHAFPETATLGFNPFGDGVNGHASHMREVNDLATFGGGSTAGVTSAIDGKVEEVGAGK